MVAATVSSRLCRVCLNPRTALASWRRWACLVAAMLLSGSSVRAASDGDRPPVWRIGATTTVTEVTTGLPFPARVDTGATSCSIHCEAIKIKDAAPEPKDNVGKPVRILIKNSDGEEQWVKTKIAQRVKVRTSEQEDERYKVPLKLRWQDVEKKVLVTLNDRDKMKYPMLLGRNFLRGDFVVDVNLHDGD
jgi:hypothetical protein